MRQTSGIAVWKCMTPENNTYRPSRFRTLTKSQLWLWSERRSFFWPPKSESSKITILEKCVLTEGFAKKYDCRSGIFSPMTTEPTRESKFHGVFDGQIEKNIDATTLHHQNASFVTKTPGVNFTQTRARRVSRSQFEQAAKSRMCVFPKEFQRFLCFSMEMCAVSENYASVSPPVPPPQQLGGLEKRTWGSKNLIKQVVFWWFGSLDFGASLMD